ncbi:hypothetical protein BJX63DRAFT_285924 [Aspergillus granulosus]|uniref:BZIP domain-containing protein n=1 Tax=Aspergillus granulosus TaxID=176169 RepID=A0ABR4H743_9EURO
MPAKHIHTEPSQKQDPTERRRLQNRLSQRNHRRKIRDRIAKLQERVIASELRAAATLHGWQSAPCIPYEVKPSPSSASSSLSLSPSASSSPPDLQCPPAATCSPYNMSLSPMASLPVLSTPTIYDDPNGGGGGSGTSTPLVTPDGVGGAGLLGAGFGLDTMQMCEQWGFQGSVYLATETSLPQILQTLGPSSNAIILVPTPGYSVGTDPGAVGYTQGQPLDMGACQCQNLGWMNCPLHLG